MPRSRPSSSTHSASSRPRRQPDDTEQPLLDSDPDEPIITFAEAASPARDPLAVAFASSRPAARNVFDELEPRGTFSEAAERRPMGDVSRGRSFEMRARNVGAQPPSQSVSPSNLNPSFVLVDIPIESSDTLPSFAIKYHVTTAELKRLNNMFHDQDFYSRQSLRVPIHKYGILAERYLTDTVNPFASSANTLIDLSTSPDDGAASPSTADEVTSISLRGMMGSQSREAKLFLQNMDRDLARLSQAALAAQQRPRSPEPATEEHPTARQMRVEPLDGLGCDGADLGIPVKVIILMAVVLTVVLPMAFLAYKLYCYHHPGMCSDVSGGDSSDGSGVTTITTLMPH
ncbi:lysM and putative peptidoglycan-binding domain-containing protein 3-like isoform X1 [Paramacrobiotus metropolitanus]|uniref:lysM and putative peptidoglycan-binding domain-containing protein 3-like isoform X1 n=1 Tax=Paramacrobiotus metropolitanus TaxID=2943436 RepID=UPI0024462D7C|nr:lysM and putative peptidoglycan-binding domain-containing protein 3-like isoform X1 [Paramacrobiotus metropolitanus]